ncbi:hypothetical protein Kpol_1004p48 [Vanderwaltozyma polyspora DSM 70294]|uniref:Extracellular mutant protein 11 C-terminal domain-containing protein n=1 Tax=Vanderwaltozyma polyspora (strain ATCC 22028 / DSM 70294 / BCRC 21397 / CBS 2163 / NBRC 10782 / NRRL Y-8283 / UCD 57-17) TaxID=436907 RepID=A7TJA4_VANPO|nr:uncharacterized protein Kpol_1004p48 [Vanderwaltozyma polyspora DSM 70294]EDO17673.1 hypothetical protein Kpol_1004p48 [Vanderwaltozyma polyspora DSM 70294]
MTIIKPEPNTIDEFKLLSSEINQNNNGSKSSSATIRSSQSCPNRPALSDISNIKKSPKQKEKDMLKQKYVNFLLSPNVVVGSNEEQNKILKVSQEKDIGSENHLVIKKESLGLMEIPKEHLKKKNYKNNELYVARHESVETGKKIEEKLIESKEITNTDNIGNFDDKNVKQQFSDSENNEERTLKYEDIRCESPGGYEICDKLLYELNDNEEFAESHMDEIFKNLQPNEEEFYRDAAKWSLPEWIGFGQKMIDEYTQHVGELVEQRIQLSYKFEIITKAINERAEALNKRGKLLDTKLNKIKDLGKEILEII